MSPLKFGHKLVVNLEAIHSHYDYCPVIDLSSMNFFYPVVELSKLLGTITSHRNSFQRLIRYCVEKQFLSPILRHSSISYIGWPLVLVLWGIGRKMSIYFLHTGHNFKFSLMSTPFVKLKSTKCLFFSKIKKIPNVVASSHKEGTVHCSCTLLTFTIFSFCDVKTKSRYTLYQKCAITLDF